MASYLVDMTKKYCYDPPVQRWPSRLVSGDDIHFQSGTEEKTADRNDCDELQKMAEMEKWNTHRRKINVKAFLH